MLSETSETKLNRRLNGASNTGPAVCQLKYKKCSYRSTVFQDLDDHPGVASKLMSTGGKSVKVCQDKCTVLSGVAHRKKPKWMHRMWIWTTSPSACTNRGVYASVCAFLCVCACVLTVECCIAHLESHSHILLHDVTAQIFISLAEISGSVVLNCFGYCWVKEIVFGRGLT